MSIKDDGGPAYPNPELGMIHFSDPGAYTGVSIRDYFAAKAMQGLITGSMADGSEMHAGDENKLAVASFVIADAMLKARQS